MTHAPLQRCLRFALLAVCAGLCVLTTVKIIGLLLLLSAATPAAISDVCVVNLSVVLLMAIAANGVAANVGNLLFRRAVRLLHRVAAFIKLCVVLVLAIANNIVLRCAAWLLYRLVAGKLQVAPIVTLSTTTRLDATAAASANGKRLVADACSMLGLGLLPFSEALPPF